MVLSSPVRLHTYVRCALVMSQNATDLVVLHGKIDNLAVQMASQSAQIIALFEALRSDSAQKFQEFEQRILDHSATVQCRFELIEKRMCNIEQSICRDDASLSGSCTTAGTKRARSSPPSPPSRSAPSASTPGDSSTDTTGGDKRKLHITTFKNALLRKEDVLATIKHRAERANLAECEWHLVGGAFGKRFAIKFTEPGSTGEAHAKQFMASLVDGDVWQSDAVSHPSSGESVKLFYAYDKTARQRRIDYCWRKLRDLIKKNCAHPENLQYDARDRIIAHQYCTICRLKTNLPKNEITIEWDPNQEVFSDAEKTNINHLMDIELQGPRG